MRTKITFYGEIAGDIWMPAIECSKTFHLELNRIPRNSGTRTYPGIALDPWKLLACETPCFTSRMMVISSLALSHGQYWRSRITSGTKMLTPVPSRPAHECGNYAVWVKTLIVSLCPTSKEPTHQPQRRLNTMNTSKKTQQKFLVISYDDNQQQWFYDFVVATSEQTAIDKVCTHRDYVIAADALLPENLNNLAQSLNEQTIESIEESERSDSNLEVRND
jgi:hypothetical protein